METKKERNERGSGDSEEKKCERTESGKKRSTVDLQQSIKYPM